MIPGALSDAHCHLDQLPDPAAALARARQAGVATVLCVTEDRRSVETLRPVARAHPEQVRVGIGLHPAVATHLDDAALAREEAFVRESLPEAHCLGEVGLDYKHADTDEKRARQQALLERLLERAAELGKPVNLHSRRAERPVAERAVAFARDTGLGALLHWFTHSRKLVRLAGEAGVYVSAGPTVCFDPQARAVAAGVPPDRLLLETDSPVPYGGEPAEPAWIPRVLEAVAGARGVPPETLAAEVQANLQRYLGEPDRVAPGAGRS